MYPQMIVASAFADELEKIAGLPARLQGELVETTAGKIIPKFSTSTTGYGMEKLRHHATGKMRARAIARARERGGIVGRTEAKIRQLLARRGAGEKTVSMQTGGPAHLP